MNPKEEQSNFHPQNERHFSYELTQKLTYFVIGAELAFCAFLLINAKKLAHIQYAKELFLVCGIAALAGLLWRFGYNETYHQQVHGKKKSYRTYDKIRALSYSTYVILSIIFFISILAAGYNYISHMSSNQTKEKTISSEFAVFNDNLKTLTEEIKNLKPKDELHIKINHPVPVEVNSLPTVKIDKKESTKNTSSKAIKTEN